MDGAALDTWPLRFAEPGDAEAICALQRAAVLRSCAGSYTGVQVRGLIERLTPAAVIDQLRRVRARVVLDDGAVCGYCTSDVARGRVEALYVAPFAVHRGAGRALLLDAEEAILAAGRREAHLLATRNSVDFYAWQGYTPGEEVSVRLARGVAFTAVSMRRSLA